MRRNLLFCFFFSYASWWIGEKNEIVKLENEIIISEIVFGMIHGQPILK
jgi:hypothetical protein